MKMNRPSLFKLSIVLCTVIVVGLGAYSLMTRPVFGQTNLAQPPAAPNAATAGRVIAVDVAEDTTRLIPDEEPRFDDGMPAYGTAFVTQGYIYPAGTLDCSAGTCNGVLEDGSPEFPDLVIGQWTCWGYVIGDGAHTTSGPIAITNQLFDLGRDPGQESLTSLGYERMDNSEPFIRAITGGTGRYYSARGEQIQTFLGANAINGVSLHVEFDVTR
jgi:hypothetical protein